MLEPRPRCARNCPPSGASLMVSGLPAAGSRPGSHPIPCSPGWGGWKPGPGQGAIFPSQPLPTATTASRSYRIDRAQSTQGLLQKLPARGPMSPVLLGLSCTAGHTCVRRWAVHRDGADGRELGTWGWLVGSLKAGIFQPDTEGKVLWVRGWGTR